MITFDFTYQLFPSAIMAVQKDASTGALEALADATVADAARSMRPSRHGEPSLPGTPPNRQTGALAKGLYWQWGTGDTVLLMSDQPYGSVHERGGKHHPARPFYMPALQRQARRGHWIARAARRIGVSRLLGRRSGRNRSRGFT